MDLVSAWSDVNAAYRTDEFAKGFFDELVDLPPDLVRLVGYQASLRGQTFATMLGGERPKLLNDLRLLPIASMITLVAYGFPLRFDGELYLRYGIDGQNPDWLRFHLELLNYLGEPLTPELIEAAIEFDSPETVELLLMHGAEIPTDISGASPPILRQLVRYGASLEEMSQEEQLRAVSVPPVFVKPRVDYFELQFIEEENVVLQIDNTIIEQLPFPGVDYKALRRALEEKRGEVYRSGELLVPWPYYSKQREREPAKPDRPVPTVAALPTSRQIYERLAENGRPVVTDPVVSLVPFNAKLRESRVPVSLYTFPLSGTPVSPTVAPPPAAV